MSRRPVPPTPSVAADAAAHGIGVYEWSPETKALTWDAAAAAIFRAAPDEPAYDACLRVIHPDDIARVIDTFARFETVEGLYRLVFDDGVRHVLGRVTQVVKGPEGAPVKLVGILIDVTAAHEQGFQLTAMLESISDGFFDVDEEFRFVYVNRAAEALLQIHREELLGRVVWEAFPMADETMFADVLRRVMSDRVAEDVTDYYPAPLGLWVEARVQPSANGIAIYFRDVSAQQAEDEERDRLLEAERRARSAAEVAQQEAERARAEEEAARAEAVRAKGAAERALRQLAEQASTDELTGLLNRTEFSRLAQRRLDGARGRETTALFIDVDRFKLVNDSMGHAAGDILLVEVAERLRRLVRQEDLVARLGGDEFVVLLSDSGPELSQTVAERLLESIREPVVVQGRTISASASVGLASAHEGTTVETLLRDADMALYRAKDAGRDALAWFDVDAHDELLRRVVLEDGLRAATAVGAIALHYQPIWDLHTRRLVGVEALARWTSPELGAVPPSVFVPLAEDAGLARALGGVVFEAGCAQAAKWTDIRDFRVWLNVSPRQFSGAELAGSLLRCLDANGLEPHRLGIEVTESALLDQLAAERQLGLLSEAGVAVAIDDFGTGYSSLARVTSLPIDVLKIDRSFVAGSDSERGRAAVRAVVQFARALGISTIAEGIETPEQLAFLRRAGADAGAGYLLGHPAPADDLDPSRLPW